MLDIGSGAGWPGLLLGRLSNCHVTLLDIPLNALSQAAERAAADGMADRVKIIAGSGTSLPFGDGIFDRVSHSDVLCCLPQKFEFLKEARRVAEKGARMHFSVILPAEGLVASDYARVLETKTKPHRRAIQTETMDMERAGTLHMETYAETIILKWETKVDGEFKVGIENPEGGALLPVTVANIVAALTALPDLWLDLRTQATGAALFRETIMEDDAGNS